MRLRRWRERIGFLVLLTSACEVHDMDISRSGWAEIPRDFGEDLARDSGVRSVEIELVVLDNPGLSPRDVTDAVVTKLRLEVLGPEHADLHFAERIEVFAQAPGIGRVRIAHQDDFPVGARVVHLETDDVDLRDYLAHDHVTIVAELSGTPPDCNVQVEAIANVHIGVSATGACGEM